MSGNTTYTGQPDDMLDGNIAFESKLALAISVSTHCFGYVSGRTDFSPPIMKAWYGSSKPVFIPTP
jgi:hypothetical protein